MLRSLWVSISLLCLFALSAMSQSAFAEAYKTLGYFGCPISYGGGAFQKTVYPVDVTEKALGNTAVLKQGVAESVNILRLVELGDASLTAAARNGNLSKVYYVDKRPTKLNLYYLFFQRNETVAYGE